MSNRVGTVEWDVLSVDVGQSWIGPARTFVRPRLTMTTSTHYGLETDIVVWAARPGMVWEHRHDRGYVETVVFSSTGRLAAWTPIYIAGQRIPIEKRHLVIQAVSPSGDAGDRLEVRQGIAPVKDSETMGRNAYDLPFIEYTLLFGWNGLQPLPAE